MESTRSRVVSLTRKVSATGIVLLTLMVPLLFLPFTMEFFEFNKSVLFVGVMLVVLVSWLINLAFTGTVSFWKTSFDNWILAVLGISIVSLAFSQHKVTSFIGFSGRLSEGIIVLVFMIAMTFIIRQVIANRNVIDLIVWTLLISGALVSIVAVLHYYGFYLFEAIDRLESTGSRTFSLIGSSHVTPFVLAAIIPVGVGFLLSSVRNSSRSLIALVLLSVNLIGFAVTTGNFWTWPGVFLWVVMLASVGFVFFAAGSSVRRGMTLLVVAGVVLFGAFMVRNMESIEQRLVGTEDPYLAQPVLPYDVAWRVSASTLSQSPVSGLVGSGPDTFAYDFTRYRPVSYNATENWNIRFTRSSSQILETLGNIGVLGFVAWLLMFFTAVVWLSRTLKENHENPFRLYLLSFGAGIGVLILSSFITFFTITMWYLLWLFLGLVVATRAVSNPRLAEKVKLSLSLSREKISVEEHDILPFVMLIPALIIFLVGMWGLVRIYRAEKYYQDARYNIATADEDADAVEVLTGSLQSIALAVSQVDFRDSYHADYGVLSVNLLREYSRMTEEEETDQYQTIMNTLLSLSTESVEKATELNPINVRNWESRAYVYQELVKLTQGGYGDALLAAINEALRYDPVKPQLYHQKGVVLSLGGLDDEALDELRTAINLQPLFLSARYDLAMQYQKMGRTQDAIAQLSFILEVLERNELTEIDAYRQIADAIDTLEEGLPVEEEGIPDESDELGLPEPEDISTEEEYEFPEEGGSGAEEEVLEEPVDVDAGEAGPIDEGL